MFIGNFAVTRFISIHALCEEGDQPLLCHGAGEHNFYPRPLRGGRQLVMQQVSQQSFISIHALCEEGDWP